MHDCAQGLEEAACGKSGFHRGQDASFRPFDGCLALCGGNLVYWYDADSQSAAPPEQEKPKGPTDADVRRLADEIKSLKRPQQ